MVSDALPHLDGYIEQLGTPETLEQAIAERNTWIESAAMFHKNEMFYVGLLDQIAAHLGPEAYTADDGTAYTDEPVRIKLPELVAHRISSLSGVGELVEALEAVRDMQPEPFAYPEDWSDQIKACAECKRYEGHPIQRGICDTHRKPLWARERHDSDEEKRLGYRMKRAIDAALSRFQSDGRDLG